ncbi:MAG: hypothetical protein PHG00_15690 [Methylococcales bacterium]|nr:hypothetical protein [Methylococcales bacterium]
MSNYTMPEQPTSSSSGDSLPTCVQELDKQFGLNIAGSLMDHIENSLR